MSLFFQKKAESSVTPLIVDLENISKTYSTFNFRGVGAMEIVAMDMKLRGMYIARQLSFTGVTFKIEEVPLTQQYIYMYNKSVKLVNACLEQFALIPSFALPVNELTPQFSLFCSG